MINEPQQQLSEREQAILRLVASGLSNQQIANQLGISINTVKVHLRNVFGKIGAASRTEATMYAVRTGLVVVGRDGDLSESDVHVTRLPEVNELTSVPAAKELQVNDLGTTSEIASSSLIGTRPTHANAPRVGVAVAVQEVPQRQQPRLLLLLIPLLLIVVLGAVWASGLLQWNQSTTRNENAPPSTEPNALMRPSWQELPSLPMPRAAFATANLGDFIYVIGGENIDGVLGSVARYDARAQVWTELSEKPTPAADVHAVRIGDKLYVPGGRLSADAKNVTDVFERYDPRTERWETLKPLPAPRSGYALATLEGKLYLFGGWDGTSYRNEVFLYEPDREEWRTMTAMPTARAFAEAGVVEGNIYIIGGENERGALSVNEVYTPAQEGSQAWATRAPMPQRRSRFGAVTALSLIYVVGGDTPNASPLKYETLTDKWEPLDAAPEPIGRQPGVVMLNTLLVSLGGQIEDNTYSRRAQSYQALSTVFLPRQ